MNRFPRRLRWIASLTLTILAAAGISVIPGATVAQIGTGLFRASGAAAVDYVALPLNVGGDSAPVVMLAMSVDEQLHRVAYNDYSDVNGDGVIDPTYVDSVEYRGYFDSRLCYSYSGDRYRAAAGVVPGTHKCAGTWSGNFLNWVSMSRLDVIRAGLYGGLRVAGDDDDERGTILERAYLPPESAAWVKVYRGPDPISDYTPFDVDASNPISFCNVSLGNGNQNVADSRNDTASRPLLRVAQGNFPLWSSTELLQCLWDEGIGDRPALSNAGSAEFVVRIDACASDSVALRESFCRGYPAADPAVWRPAGKLQEFGESGQLRFGLMSGSYARPRSGGQLRRNPGRLAGNGADPAVCVPGDEIRLSDGVFCNNGNGSEGIINTLDRLRPSRYSFNTGNTPDSAHADCEGGNRDVSNRGAGGVVANPNSCNGIGNPVAEMMAETLRYLSGAAAPTAAFDASGRDGDFINGIPTPAWRDPFVVDELCAECSVVVISSGSNSFDADQLPAITQLGLGTADAIAAETSRIGLNEGMNGSRVLAGRVTPVGDGVDTINDSCEVRTLVELDDARGICPAQPGREGGFHVAGLSLAAWTRDLRAIAGRQRARTFALTFGDELGSIRIPTPTGAITVTPACELAGFPPRSCALVSMQPGPLRSNRPRTGFSEPYVYGRTIAADGRSGSVMVSWHAAAYGFQRDDEVTQVLSWCVGSSCSENVNAYAAGSGASDICWRAETGTSSPCAANGSVAAIAEDEVVIRTEIITARASVSETIGYSIEGAAAGNGTLLLVSRPNEFPPGSGQFVTNDNLINAAGGGAEPATSGGSLSGGAAFWGRPQVRRYTAGNGVRRLENPLFYAAKYGSFDSADGPLPAATGAAPCPVTSWDRIDNRTGDPVPDCVPDNFHDLQNPGDFITRLDRLLQGLSLRAAGGELSLAGAAVSSVGQGVGAVYQALYETTRNDGNNPPVSWTGTLQALFTDRDGNLREDGVIPDGLLDEDDYAGHPVVQIFFDEVAGETRFRRFSANPADNPAAFTVVNDLRQLRTIWNARRQLSSLANGSLAVQRPYANLASSGRHIFTFADLDLDGRADADEQVDLTEARFGSGRYGVLDVSSVSEAASLINFTRGQDGIAGLRSRRLNEDGVGDAEVIRLGDIVNSAPLAVGAPAEAYDLLYADQSYAAFFQQYRTRRNVVYVGANDGMLHAFNAGFLPATGTGFQTLPPAPDGETAHPLGSELWAYVPFNLLPHLGWMADPDYGHVWTMDGSPRAFDVRIFAADGVHPNGWGTILVVPMRLGGKSIRIPVAGGGFDDFSPGLGTSTELVTRPAVVILDVTDPEAPPRLIAEFSHEALGFTTSNPAIAAFASPGAAASGSAGSADDRWYLMFGNGPQDLRSAESPAAQTAKLFRLDLKTLVDGTGPAVDALIDDGPVDLAGSPARGFVGDPVAVDWDLNFRADALYFGTSGGTATAPTGKLYRLDFRNPANNPAIEGSVPAGWQLPAVLLEAGRPILAAPSVTQDRAGNRWVLGGTGRYLADSDRSSGSPQALFGVIDGGDAPVNLMALVDTTAARVTVEGNVSNVTGNLGDGLPATDEARLVDLVAGARGWRYTLGGTATTAERSVNRTALIDSLLFATSFTPSDSQCTGTGDSRLFGFDFRTGAPRSSRPAFGVDLTTPGTVLGVVDLGSGLGTAPTLHLNSAGPTGRGTVTINVQSSTGAIFQRDADVSGAVRSNEIDWRETHPNSSP